MKTILPPAFRHPGRALPALAATILLIAGCDSGPKSARGFRLPDGNAGNGQAVFVKFQCHACHTVQGVELPAPGSKSPISVNLGGEVLRVRTYGDLVTSVINPSHVISEKYLEKLHGQASPMPEYNDSLTVTQLIDLVAFLQPHYTLLQVEPMVIQ